MNGYMQIYGLILFSGIISALMDRKICPEKKDSIPVRSLFFATIYYYVIVLFRVVLSDGRIRLGSSFADKTLRAYGKVIFLEVAVFIGIIVLFKIGKKKFAELCQNTVGAFAALELLYTVLVDFPVMNVTVVLGMGAIVIGALITRLNRVEKFLFLFKDRLSMREKYLMIGCQIALFGVVFLLNGPTELYVYNQGDFLFPYNRFIVHMVVYLVGMLLVYSILLAELVKGKLFDGICLGIFLYTIMNYIQTLFLNGEMATIDGATQVWSANSKAVNAIIWLILIVLFVVIWVKTKHRNKIVLAVSAYVGLIQLVTFVFLILTTNVLGGQKKQLTTDGMFELSAEENIVVFILDAYDVQYIDKVLAEDANYLSPLQDFTYYNHMESRFSATDGSLPYLLTGIKGEKDKLGTEEYTELLYGTTTFLPDIKKAGYDVRILTDSKYAEPFKENYIDNYVDSYFCELDMGKTVSGMSKCIRYRGLPFVAKEFYHYENYDLTNLIQDTNIYLYGTDPEFAEKIAHEGLSVGNVEKALRIYHLYGAHCPYYLTEEATLDYSSTPMAQWKGSLKIVYDYIEQMKRENIYDQSVIIITADHGLNETHRGVMEDLNIAITEDSNPIFFLKRKGETHEEMQLYSEETSHDDFFPTIIKSIDGENNQYGNAIWEKQ